MKLSIVIPVYNEVRTIEAIIKKVMEADAGMDKELVLVDDCSKDGTTEILRKIAARNKDWKVMFHEVNRGKGAALRTGFEAASGDIVLIQDADLEYDPGDYKALVGPIVGGHADVVFGSRFLGGGPHRVAFFWHYVGNKVITMFSNMMTNLNLTDIEVCYKVFRRDVLREIVIQENRFGVEVELTAKVARSSWRIYEVPVAYYGRSYAEGKKITWKDGFRALWCILKFRFV